MHYSAVFLIFTSTGAVEQVKVKLSRSLEEKHSDSRTETGLTLELKRYLC